MRPGRRITGMLLATLVGISAPSWATDEPDELMPGKITVIKGPGTLAKFVAKPLGAPFVLPAATNDPTAAGATLRIFDTLAGIAGDDTYDLPAPGWKGLGNPPGDKGFKYKGAGSPTDPCKVVLVKEKVIKAVCKGPGVTLAPPVSGDVGVILTLGTDSKRYCARFGGTGVKNQDGLTKRKDAPAPGACAVLSSTTSTSTSSSSTSTSSTSTSSTSTTSTSNTSSTSSSSTSTTSTTVTTTSTTTSTLPCVCGNGTTQAECGETCDDGNTSNEDTCPADCSVDPCTLVAAPGPIASVNFTPPPGISVAGITVFVDYPEGKVSLPGSGSSASGSITDTPPGAFATVNDFDHALREVIASGGAIAPGLLFRMNFQACVGAPAPTPGDFICLVTDASDPLGNTLTGVTCAVTVP
jgi:hypothetical protein